MVRERRGLSDWWLLIWHVNTTRLLAPEYNNNLDGREGTRGSRATCYQVMKFKTWRSNYSNDTCITCKRGSAKHSVKDDYAFLRFSGTCPAETPQPINMKFCTIDYVGEVTRCAKIGWNRLTGGGPTNRWNITSKTFLTIPDLTLPFSFFLYASTPKTTQPIYTHDGSNDAVYCKEVPFGGRVDKKLHFGVKIPQKPQILNWDAKFPAK
jgi:hypothetical protein